jgi:hypothetical protein
MANLWRFDETRIFLFLFLFYKEDKEDIPLSYFWVVWGNWHGVLGVVLVVVLSLFSFPLRWSEG